MDEIMKFKMWPKHKDMNARKWHYDHEHSHNLKGVK